jgi:hypothetical protein
VLAKELIGSASAVTQLLDIPKNAGLTQTQQENLSMWATKRVHLRHTSSTSKS